MSVFWKEFFSLRTKKRASSHSHEVLNLEGFVLLPRAKEFPLLCFVYSAESPTRRVLLKVSELEAQVSTRQCLGQVSVVGA